MNKRVVIPNLASYIDHTLLRADATEEEVFSLTRQAKMHKFYSVCVNGLWVKFAKHFLRETDVKVCAVVGFPLGAMSTSVKSFETAQAILHGADEIDMVMQIGALKSENYTLVFDDIKSVVHHAAGKPVKVILETCLLERDEIAKACEISVQAGAQFVKTSTGMSTSGATIEVVKLMREVVGPGFGVKASGGIRTRDQALKMIEAGATRLGTSNSIAIVLGSVQNAEQSATY